MFTIGEKPIFPVVLWQIYYFIGMVFAKRYLSKRNKNSEIIKHLAIASILFLIGAAAYHSHHFAPCWELIRDQYSLVVSKFPLNFLGLIYYGGFLYIMVCLAVLFWPQIQKMRGVSEIVELLGRHSLMVFVIHVYFAKGIELLKFKTGVLFPFAQVLIMTNLFVTIIILRRLECVTCRKKKSAACLHENAVLEKRF